MSRPANPDGPPNPDAQPETHQPHDFLTHRQRHGLNQVEKARRRQMVRPADELWDSMITACGIQGAIPASARGAYNKALQVLREANATPKEVVERAREYRSRFNVPLTPSALAKHWAELLPTLPEKPIVHRSQNWDPDPPLTPDQKQAGLREIKDIRQALRPR